MEGLSESSEGERRTSMQRDEMPKTVQSLVGGASENYTGYNDT